MAHSTGIYPGFCSVKWLGVFLFPHGWVARPSQGYSPAFNSLVPIFTPAVGGDRYCESKVSCHARTQHNEPRPLKPESSTLTLRQPRLTFCITETWPQFVSKVEEDCLITGRQVVECSSKFCQRFLEILGMFWGFFVDIRFPFTEIILNKVCFLAAYENFEDMHKDLLDDNVEGVFMERLRAFYFYRDIEDDDDNLRVFDTVPADITYKMALKRNTTCNFLQKNFCFRHRLENPLIDSLVKNYTIPLKVFNAWFG